MLGFNEYTNVIQLGQEIQAKTDQAASFEQAAQSFMEIIHQTFPEVLVLGRVYVTVPFDKLPPTNKSFVTSLAGAKGVTNLLNEQTLVLSLVGSHGANNSWNDRRLSKGHVGIPLISAKFINDIPMMSRLLNEVGLTLDWIGKDDSSLVEKTMGGLTGLFYVADAKTDTDHEGRKIISAQDFVNTYNVKTVFGFGGGFTTQNRFMVCLFFTKENVDKNKARLFSSLIGSFKSKVLPLVRQEKIFDA